MKKKSFLIILLTLIIIVLIMLLIVPITIKYSDDASPTTKYNITINKLSRILSVESNHSDSTGQTRGYTTNNNIKLSSQEYWKIWFIYYFMPFDRDYLILALDDIALDSEIMYNSNDDFYEEDYDINKDGVVLHREFGNSFLNIILKR